MLLASCVLAGELLTTGIGALLLAQMLLASRSLAVPKEKGKYMSRSAVADRAEEARHGLSADGGGGGGSVTRVTVNLIPRASDALQRLAELTGDSKTDIINRALHLYRYVEETTSNGGEIYIREPKDSEPRLLKML